MDIIELKKYTHYVYILAIVSMFFALFIGEVGLSGDELIIILLPLVLSLFFLKDKFWLALAVLFASIIPTTLVYVFLFCWSCSDYDGLEVIGFAPLFLFTITVSYFILKKMLFKQDSKVLIIILLAFSILTTLVSAGVLISKNFFA